MEKTPPPPARSGKSRGERRACCSSGPSTPLRSAQDKRIRWRTVRPEPVEGPMGAYCYKLLVPVLSALGACQSPTAAPLSAAPAAGRPEQASFLSLHVAVTDLYGRTFRHQTLGLRERTGVAFAGARPDRPLELVVPGATITLSADSRQFRLDADL